MFNSYPPVNNGTLTVKETLEEAGEYLVLTEDDFAPTAVLTTTNTLNAFVPAARPFKIVANDVALHAQAYTGAAMTTYNGTINITHYSGDFSTPITDDASSVMFFKAGQLTQPTAGVSFVNSTTPGGFKWSSGVSQNQRKEAVVVKLRSNDSAGASSISTTASIPIPYKTSYITGSGAPLFGLANTYLPSETSDTKLPSGVCTLTVYASSPDGSKKTNIINAGSVDLFAYTTYAQYLGGVVFNSSGLQGGAYANSYTSGTGVYSQATADQIQVVYVGWDNSTCSGTPITISPTATFVLGSGSNSFQIMGTIGKFCHGNRVYFNVTHNGIQQGWKYVQSDPGYTYGSTMSAIINTSADGTVGSVPVSTTDNINSALIREVSIGSGSGYTLLDPTNQTTGLVYRFDNAYGSNICPSGGSLQTVTEVFSSHGAAPAATATTQLDNQPANGLAIKITCVKPNPSVLSMNAMLTYQYRNGTAYTNIVTNPSWSVFSNYVSSSNSFGYSFGDTLSSTISGSLATYWNNVSNTSSTYPAPVNGIWNIPHDITVQSGDILLFTISGGTTNQLANIATRSPGFRLILPVTYL